MEQRSTEQRYSGGVIEGPPEPRGADAPQPEEDKPTTAKARRWVFTFFPQREDDNIWDEEDMAYMYYGEETCPTTGKRHHQGWFITHNPRSERALCKKYKCYIRIQRGTYTHNWKYCGKDGVIKEHGKRPEPGKRTDLDELKNKIVESKITPDDVAIEEPMMYHKYGRTLEKIHDITLRKTWRTEKTECIWYVSPTGCGKSHKAFKDYNPETHYVWVDDKGWWDNYRQQETVIIDDFRGQIPYNVLLRLTDKWPFDVSRRGRPPMPFKSKRIIITSSMKPHEVYHNLAENDSLDQLMRRIRVETVWKTHH